MRGSSLTGMYMTLVIHVTTQDEIYNGYFIPKGTSLLGNIWFVANRRRGSSWMYTTFVAGSYCLPRKHILIRMCLTLRGSLVRFNNLTRTRCVLDGEDEGVQVHSWRSRRSLYVLRWRWQRWMCRDASRVVWSACQSMTSKRGICGEFPGLFGCGFIRDWIRSHVKPFKCRIAPRSKTVEDLLHT